MSFYRFCRAVAKPFIKLIFPYSVKGKENLPESGGYIFCCNHISLMDAPFWGVALKCQLHFMAKEETFSNPFGKFFMTHLEMFPVKRGSGDMSAINTARDTVQNGGVLGIFPEGTRSKNGEPGRAKSGVSYIANMCGACVVPAAICCKGNVRPFKRVKLIIGKPIPADTFSMREDESRKDFLRRSTGTVMEEIIALRNEGMKQ